jgi:hypothetical protein
LHLYEIRPRENGRGVDLVSDQLSHGRLWYSGENAVENAIGYASFYSRAHDVEIRIYDADGELTETRQFGVRMAGDGISAREV